MSYPKKVILWFLIAVSLFACKSVKKGGVDSTDTDIKGTESVTSDDTATGSGSTSGTDTFVETGSEHATTDTESTGTETEGIETAGTETAGTDVTDTGTERETAVSADCEGALVFPDIALEEI